MNPVWSQVLDGVLTGGMHTEPNLIRVWTEPSHIFGCGSRRLKNHYKIRYGPREMLPWNLLISIQNDLQKFRTWQKNITKCLKSSCTLFVCNCYICRLIIRPFYWRHADEQSLHTYLLSHVVICTYFLIMCIKFLEWPWLTLNGLDVFRGFAFS